MIRRTDHVRPPHRAVPKYRDDRAKPAPGSHDVCPKCSAKLDPVKYHDCGEQLQIPVDIRQTETSVRFTTLPGS